MLELGAGAGLAGMVLAATGLAREVVLTDGNPTVVATLQLNVQKNAAAFSRTKVSAHMLHWAKYDGHLGYFDVIIAADWYALTPLLPYTPHLHAPVEDARIHCLGATMARRAATPPWWSSLTGLHQTKEWRHLGWPATSALHSCAVLSVRSSVGAEHTDHCSGGTQWAHVGIA